MPLWRFGKSYVPGHCRSLEVVWRSFRRHLVVKKVAFKYLSNIELSVKNDITNYFHLIFLKGKFFFKAIFLFFYFKANRGRNLFSAEQLNMSQILDICLCQYVDFFYPHARYFAVSTFL